MWQRDAETIEAHTTETKISYVCVTDTDRRDTDGVDWQRHRHMFMAEEKKNVGEGRKCVLHTGTERGGERDNVCAGRGRKGERRGMEMGEERGRRKRKGKEGRREHVPLHTHTLENQWCSSGLG